MTTHRIRALRLVIASGCFWCDMAAAQASVDMAFVVPTQSGNTPYYSPTPGFHVGAGLTLIHGGIVALQAAAAAEGWLWPSHFGDDCVSWTPVEEGLRCKQNPPGLSYATLDMVVRPTADRIAIHAGLGRYSLGKWQSRGTHATLELAPRLHDSGLLAFVDVAWIRRIGNGPLREVTIGVGYGVR